MNRLRRAIYKVEQVYGFFARTRTPLLLSLDTLKQRRKPFTAVSGEGLRLRLQGGVGESFTFFENLVRRDYLRNGIEIGPGDTVVDIGANIGLFSVMAASIVGPSGRVFAIEPVSSIFTRLKENVALNELSNVVCINKAVDARPGELALRIDRRSALTSAYHGGDKAVEIVTCKTLEQIVDENAIANIKLLKIDCEGSEHGIFGSMSDSLADGIDQIVMEVHTFGGHSTDELERRLEELGFDVRITPGHPWVARRKAGSRRPSFNERQLGRLSPTKQ